MIVPIRRAVTWSGGALLMLASAAHGFAADLGGLPDGRRFDAPDYSTPALHWQGLYAGINAGYGFGRDFNRETSPIPYNAIDFERFGVRNNGFAGGGQIGYNYQMGHLVLGIEADFGFANVIRSATSPTGAVTNDGSGGFVGTVRPRLGLAFGPWMLYGTGGFAYGKADSTLTGNTGNTLTASSSDWRTGWVGGVGTEFAFDRNWSVRVEALHINLGRVDMSGIALDGNTYTWKDHLTENMLRLGINYRF